MDTGVLPPFVRSRTCGRTALPWTVVEKDRSPPSKKTKGGPSEGTGETQFFPGVLSPRDGVLRERRRRSRRGNSIYININNVAYLQKNYYIIK